MGCTQSAPASNPATPVKISSVLQNPTKETSLSVLERLKMHLVGWEAECDHACNDDTNFCCNQLYIPLCCCLPGPLDDDEKLNEEYRSCRCNCCKTEKRKPSVADKVAKTDNLRREGPKV